jgi:predicted negative regulator of RcsB-dependent stress response
MPKAIKKKVKKKTTATETEVKDRFADLITTFQNKQKSALLISVIVIAVVIIIASFLFYQYKATVKSRQLAYEAYKTFYNEYQKNTLSKQEQFQQALDLFQQAYNKKKSPRLLLYIASSYYELGKYEDALKTLNDFIKKYDQEKEMLPLAYQKMAAIYISKANNDEALKTLETMYKSTTNIYKDFALIASGRILEEDGKKEDAMSKYKELTEKFPESPFFEEAKSKLAVSTESKEGE